MKFDDALPKIINLAIKHFGKNEIGKNAVLRDASGRLTFIIRSQIDASMRDSFDKDALSALKQYTDIPSATPEELFDESLQINDEAISEPVPTTDDIINVNLIDRRIIGEDWNKPNFTQAVSGTPIITFYSCKGGVGRSTALAVAASAFSDLGKNTLIIDLDLEAPGLGPIFLSQENLPEFGSLDYYAESTLGDVDDDFLRACLAPSPLTAGQGLVEVMPAVGRIGHQNPHNILPKLGRASLDKTTDQGKILTFLGQTRQLLQRISGIRHHDAIFIDARAGLSESTAASLIGLGGNLLLFGVDTPQTFESYAYLLSHLKRFVPDIHDADDDWRTKLRMVHAKAARGNHALKSFRDHAHELFSSYLYEEAGPSDLTEAFNFDIDDPDAPHFAWPIPYDAEYAEFDPLTQTDLLTREFFNNSFGIFAEKLVDMVFQQETNNVF